MASGTETLGKGTVFSAPWISRATAFGILAGVLLVIYAVLVGPLVAAYGEVNGTIAQ